MNLGSFFPEGLLERLTYECTRQNNPSPKSREKVLALAAVSWKRLLASGYAFRRLEFQAACLGFFHSELTPFAPVSLLTPPRAFIACRLALGMNKEEIAAESEVTIRYINWTLTYIRRAWQLPPYTNRPELIAMKSAQAGYAPPPLLNQRVLKATWDQFPRRTRWRLINKARGRHPANLDPRLLRPLGLRAWSGLPLVISAVYPRLLEVTNEFESPFIPPEDEEHLTMITRGWLPWQIGCFFGGSEDKVRQRERTLMQQFNVETRIELAYRALLHRYSREGEVHYP